MPDNTNDYEPDGEPIKEPDWEVGRVYADKHVGTTSAILWRRRADGRFDRNLFPGKEWRIVEDGPVYGPYYGRCYAPFTPMRLKMPDVNGYTPGEPLASLPLDGTPWIAGGKLWKFTDHLHELYDDEWISSASEYDHLDNPRAAVPVQEPKPNSKRRPLDNEAIRWAMTHRRRALHIYTPSGDSIVAVKWNFGVRFTHRNNCGYAVDVHSLALTGATCEPDDGEDW